MKIAITILQLLCGLAIILIVLLQSGKSEGLSGAIGGVADSFLAKNKAKTIDAKLARATKWFGAVFLILTLILLIIGRLICAESTGYLLTRCFFIPENRRREIFPRRYAKK